MRMAVHVSVRLDRETLARLDALAPQFSTRWRSATRSDVVRGLILSALDGYERGRLRPDDAAAMAVRESRPPGRKKERGGGEAR